MLRGFQLLSCGVLAVMMSLTMGGCSSSPSDIKAVDSGLDLRGYRQIQVAKLVAADGVVVPDDVLADATGKIKAALANTKAFDAIVQTPPADKPYACLTTRVVQYEPGSRMARAMLIGMGTATFRIDVTVTDGRTGQALAKGELKEFWGWGGIAGASKGIEELVDDGCQHVASGVVKAFQPSR